MMRMLCALLWCASCLAQPAIIRITGPWGTAVGGNWSGKIVVTNPGLVCGGIPIPANTITVTVSGGVVTSVNDGFTTSAALSLYALGSCPTSPPGGYSYTVRYAGNPPAVRYWTIPATPASNTVATVESLTTAAPTGQVALTQLAQGNASTGQVLSWLGASWGPSSSGTSGGGTYLAPFTAVSYSVGAIAVTNGSTAVTGVGTAWDLTMSGRQLLVDTCGYSYTFTVLSPTSGRLNAPWGCDTAGPAPAAFHSVVFDPTPLSIVTGVNDALTVAVNGAAPVTVTLSLSDVNSASLAANIQAQLTAACIPASATAAGGVVTIATMAIGSGATLQLGGDAALLLGLAPNVVGQGTDGATYQLMAPVVVPGTVHSLGTSALRVSCFYSFGNTLVATVPASVAVDPTTYDVTILFWVPGSGMCALYR